MKQLLIFAAMLVTLAGAANTERAEYIFFNRHFNPAWLDSAHDMLATAHAADPTDEHCLYLWSRIHIQKGDDAKTKLEKLTCFRRAKALAESLIALNDRNDEAHCWWGVAQGRIGQTRGVLNSLFMVPGLKRAFGRALELNPKHPTALDAMGVLYYELPGLPAATSRSQSSTTSAASKAPPTTASSDSTSPRSTSNRNAGSRPGPHSKIPRKTHFRVLEKWTKSS